eukprot:IDg13729t1
MTSSYARCHIRPADTRPYMVAHTKAVLGNDSGIGAQTLALVVTVPMHTKSSVETVAFRSVGAVAFLIFTSYTKCDAIIFPPSGKFAQGTRRILGIYFLSNSACRACLYIHSGINSSSLDMNCAFLATRERASIPTAQRRRDQSGSQAILGGREAALCVYFSAAELWVHGQAEIVRDPVPWSPFRGWIPR